MSSRALILGRVRAALADVAAEPATWVADDDGDDAAARYRRDSPLRGAALSTQFVERCGEYRANVLRVPRGDIAGAIAAACERHSVASLLAPADLPPQWRPPGITLTLDAPPLSIGELDAAAGAVTGCALAIAETGTIVLDGGFAQGRRVLTLLPDLHICVVDARQILGSVPEAVERLGQGVRSDRRPITFVSGPSATSDIELRRVEGVHGPRRLEVVVAS
jgi:L-lactate dehydrogenase complex protein LldG